MNLFQKGRVSLCSLLVVTALYPLAEAEGEGNGQMTVKQELINVREGPDISYPVVDTLPLGDIFTIQKEKGEWIKIKTNAGKEGWVAKWLTEASSRDKSVKERGIGIVTDTINVRTHASLRGEVLGKITKGSKVEIIISEGNWVKIPYNSAYGWIHKDYLRLSGNPTGSRALTGINSSSEKEDSDGAEENNGPSEKKDSNDMIADRILSKQKTSIAQLPADGEVIIKQNGTNIRTRPDVRSLIVSRTFIGDRFKIIGVEEDWYKIRLESGASAYVASWVVSVSGNAQRVTKQGPAQYLSDKLIVIDPGHGGKDRGTKGVKGTLEKNLTLETALLLRDKLEAAGATVVLTRNTDTDLSLPSRVKVSHRHNADAYISLHYDNADNQLVSGVTTYYYHSYQKSLAASISNSLGSSLQTVNRGYRFGDYHVLRENERASAILELGYLSNESDEAKVTSKQYQEDVSDAIYSGLENYFN